MAAYTPPPSPGTLRSSRKRALEIGTERSGFEGTIPYDATAGVPVGASTGHYVQRPPAVGGPGGSINTPTPFANLKK